MRREVIRIVDLPSEYSGTNTADLYWHGAGFDEGLYNKTGIYAVNKLPGMIELSQKVKNCFLILFLN